MIQAVRSLLKKKFVFNVAVVLVGSAGAQVINVIAAPIVTRLYGPESYGVFGSVMAFISMLVPVAALGYPAAVVVANEDDEATALSVLSWMATLVGCFFLLLLLIGFDYFHLLGKFEDVSILLYIGLISVVFGSFQQVTQYLMLRNEAFRSLSVTAISNSIVANFGRVGAGCFWPAAVSLVAVTNVSYLLYFFSQLRLLGIKLNKTWSSCSLKEIVAVAKKYREFPLYRAPQLFLNALTQSFPTFILFAYYGAAAAGYYVLTKTILALPANLVRKSVANVFFPRVNQAFLARQEAFPLILRATLGLSLIGLIPFLIIGFFGPEIFSFFFGAEWGAAGEYARWLSIWLFFGFINGPASVSLPVFSLLQHSLWYEVLSSIFRLASLIIFVSLDFTDIEAVAAFCFAGAICNVLLVVGVMFKVSRVDSARRVRE